MKVRTPCDPCQVDRHDSKTGLGSKHQLTGVKKNVFIIKEIKIQYKMNENITSLRLINSPRLLGQGWEITTPGSVRG